MKTSKKLFRVLILVMLVVSLLPVTALAASTPVATYDEFVAAVKAGATEIDITADFTVTMSTDPWVRPRLPEGCKINGNNHTITLDYLYNGNNGNFLFYTEGNATIENLTFDASSLRRGTRVCSLTDGDVMRNVTVKGDGNIYGVSVAGNATIENCQFSNCKTAVYISENIDPAVTITGSTFTDCAYVAILRGDNSVFIGNTVTDGKLNVMGTAEVTDNTFDGKSRIKFYHSEKAKDFSGNRIMDETYIEADATGNFQDLGGNIYEDVDTAVASDTLTDETEMTAREKALHYIDIATDGNGAVTGPTIAQAGTTVTLTITPNTGYELNAFISNVDGFVLNGSSFVMPSADLELRFTFSASTPAPVVTPTPAPAAPVAPTATPAPAPKTGDATNLALLFALVAISGVGVCVIGSKQRKAR